jgi:hypothetical protein
MIRGLHDRREITRGLYNSICRNKMYLERNVYGNMDQIKPNQEKG